MRADRLVQILVLLQNNGKMTTKQLAAILEVSERTILRDMDALTLAGYPIVSERGNTGGWRFIDSFRGTISAMKQQDLKALFILPSDTVLQALGMERNEKDIRQKLLASMPPSLKSDAQPFLEKIYIDSGTWRHAKQSDESDETNESDETDKANEANEAREAREAREVREADSTLRIVQKALWDNSKLRIRYQKVNGEQSERWVSPLGLVLQGSSWYLVALNEQGEYRSFRISRMSKAEIQPETFERPIDFHLRDFWKQHKLKFIESLPKLQVKVLAHPSIYGRMTFTDKFVRMIHVEKVTDHGMLRIDLSFHSEPEAVQYVLGFGGMMKLVEPEHLIARIVQQANMVVKMYE